jgi:hypothetical protein
MKYARQLQFLADLPNVANIKFASKEGAFLPSVIPAVKLPSEEGCRVGDEGVATNPDCKASLGDAPAFNEVLDVKIAKPWFKKIGIKIDKEIPEEIRGGASPYAREISEIKAECARQQEQK